MTAPSSTVLLMLTVIIGLYSVHLIVGEVPEVNISNKAVLKRHFDHKQNGNYSNAVISKTNKWNNRDTSQNKSLTSFWSNMIPFYDSVKNHMNNQKSTVYEANANHTNYNDWYYTTPGSRHIVKSEYPSNHLMTPIEDDTTVHKKSKYEPPRHSGYPDNRQDYEDESENYSAQDNVYTDNYNADVEQNSPILYNSPSVYTSPQLYSVWQRPISSYTRGKMCPCQSVQHQSTGCPYGAILSILSTLGLNLWKLIHLIISTIFPLLFPLLILKAVIVGFKIYKFIKTVKFILKIAIVLPFLMRVVLPAIQHLLHHNSIIHLLKMRNDDNVLENRQSLSYWKLDDLVNSTEMVICASKSACEIGAFVAAKHYKHLPDKFQYVLKRRVERSEKNGKISKNIDQEILDAFLVAFAKNWTYDKCSIYPCSISL